MKGISKMTQAQSRYLQDRLQKAYRQKPSRHDVQSLPRPKWVREATRIRDKAAAQIQRWDKAERIRKETVVKRFDAAYNRAKEAILFTDQNNALAAVKAFEKLK